MKSCKTCNDHRAEEKTVMGATGIVHTCRRHTTGGAEMPCFRDDEGGPPDGCHSDEREGDST